MVTTANVGGAIISPVVVRYGKFNINEYTPNVTTIDGQGSVDPTKSLPVNLTATATIAGTITQ